MTATLLLYNCIIDEEMYLQPDSWKSECFFFIRDVKKCSGKISLDGFTGKR